MIRINLLPVREWKRREAVRRQLSIFFLSVVLLVVGLFAAGVTIQGKVHNQRKELKALQARKAKLAYVNRKIAAVKKKKTEIESKFKAIEKLQNGRTFAVRLLDDVATAIPINRVWLKKLTLNRNVMEVSGVALDNHTVALFMRRLETSPYCKGVSLKNTNRTEIEGHALMEFTFEVSVSQASLTKKASKKESKTGGEA